MTYENRALLDLAKGMPCMVRIPGVCNHNNETTIAAHSNSQRHGKGVGLKAHDFFTCWSCSACHYALDFSHRLTRDEREWYWQIAFERTLEYLWENKLIAVK